jgi:hypothetical protein
MLSSQAVLIRSKRSSKKNFSFMRPAKEYNGIWSRIERISTELVDLNCRMMNVYLGSISPSSQVNMFDNDNSQ